jgi:hypothetical protein
MFATGKHHCFSKVPLAISLARDILTVILFIKNGYVVRKETPSFARSRIISATALAFKASARVSMRFYGLTSDQRAKSHG